MADSEECQGQKNSEEIALNQYLIETDKQPLLEADQLYLSQPLQTPVPEEQTQSGQMPISPEVHPPTKTILGSESHSAPRLPRGSRSIPPSQYVPNPYAQQQANNAVTQQPSAVHGQYVPAWIGSDSLIYWSVLNMLCCCLLTGMIALFLVIEARRRKNMGEIESAKSWTMASVICNIFTVLLGVGLSFAICVFYSTHRL